MKIHELGFLTIVTWRSSNRNYFDQNSQLMQGRAVMVTSSDFIGAVRLFTLTCGTLNMVCDWLLLYVEITDVKTNFFFFTGWFSDSCFSFFFFIIIVYNKATSAMMSWCQSVSLPRVHSVLLCGKTTKIQPKLKRSKVTPNPPVLSLTRQPLSQEHHGKSSYGTDKRHHDQSPKNKSLKNCWPGTSYDWVLMKIQQDRSVSVHLVNSS